ncbi:MAG: DUF167 domain-containing protein [Planctomycetes bacterium]|nr:DUF167 domain-containing protein [Planctomycetota bacterium]
MTAFELRARGAESELPVRVQPGASRTRIVGLWNGKLKIAVVAPPSEGRANDEVCEFLASVLGVRKSAVRVASGARSRDKRLLLALAPEVARAALLAHLA